MGGAPCKRFPIKNIIIGLGCISFLSLTMRFNMETFLKVGKDNSNMKPLQVDPLEVSTCPRKKSLQRGTLLL